jgi:carbamoyl-phosphate synthase small subunit
MSPENLFKSYTRQCFIVLPHQEVFEAQVLYSEEADSIDAELVFNTSFNGYGEIITDPSYANQFVLFTHPHIGSYGLDPTTFQSDKAQCSGIFVHRIDTTVDHHHLTETTSLTKWMLEQKTPIVFGLPSRKLTQIIREHGAMQCRLLIGNRYTKKDALNLNLSPEPMVFSDQLLKNVSTPSTYTFGDLTTAKFKLAVFDFGIKKAILQRLIDRNCAGIVYPWDTPWETVDATQPDGVVFSNGPGDPTQYASTINTIKKAIGKRPTLAICLGHQLLCLALGASATKLKFGHRGGNHPVKDFENNLTSIAAHNHGYVIQDDFLKENSDWQTWFKNLNDNTLAGIQCDHTLSVQFHPEGAPGPHDTFYVFDKFLKRMTQ